MKRFLIITIIGLIAGLPSISNAYTGDVTLNADFHSRSDAIDGVFDPNVITDPPTTIPDCSASIPVLAALNPQPYACSLWFEAGIYEISVKSGAWMSQSNEGIDGDYWFWSMNIYQDITNKFLLGNHDYENPFSDEGSALSGNLGQSVIITQPSDGNIWFYIDDPDSPRDNPFTTSVTAEITVVPEPISTTLFIAGGLVLGGRSYLRRKRA